MIPFNIGNPAAQEADQIDQDAEIRDRLRRAQVVRLGLILCLLLALFDTGPGSRGLGSVNESQADVKKPSAYVETLNAHISANAKRNLQTPMLFPRNVTGLYRGNWERLSTSSSSHGNVSASANNLVQQTPSIASSLSSLGASSSSLSSGKILMQLKSVVIESVVDMSFVYGVIRMTGAGARGADLLYPTQGVFLPTTGQLTMITSPYSTQKLYVQVPTGKNSNRSTSLPNTSQHRGRLRRRLSEEPEASSPTESGVLSRLGQYVREQQRNLQSRVLNENGVLIASSLSLSLIPSLWPSPPTSIGSRRRLQDSGSMYATKLPYGMRLVLSDPASAAALLKNDSAYLTESVSDGLLPQTFKNLQYGVLRGIPMGGCQMAVNFAAAALIVNQNDKDIPLLPGISPSSPKLTPTVGAGESFSSNLNGAVEAQSCGFPNSGFNLSAQSYHLQVNVVEHKAFNYALIATTVCFIQMGLLILQMRHAQNPAMASKVSVLGMCSHALIDALISIGHLLLCAAVPGIFLQHFMWIAMLKLLIFCAFEMRCVVGIYHARYAQEVSSQGWSGLRRRLATLHFRFYASLFLAMFVSIYLRTRPILLVLLLYSCWVPQIVFNAISGTRRALHPVYLYGMAATRLFIPLYILGCPHNFLSLLLVETAAFSYSPAACFVLVSWTAVQIGFLAVQDLFGPRFFLPKSWLPPKYDYNRPVPRHVLLNQSSTEDDASERSGSGSGSGSETSLASPSETITCVVCYNPVTLSYGEYMITPCDHVFHSDCLGTWLRQKLECPICRSSLESVE